MTLFAEARGEGGETVVFLHGFGGIGAIWGQVAEAAGGDARILVYDMPGHGRSLAFGRSEPSKTALLADLARRGHVRFHLVGHSMGGAIAALMALEAPERVLSLTLVAPGGFGPEVNGGLLADYAQARTSHALRTSHGAMAAAGHAVPDALLAALVEARARPGLTEALVALAAVVSRNDGSGVIARERFATLTMPIKVLWGTADRVLPYGQSAGLPPLFALHSFEGAGHMLAEERPEEVIVLIRQNLLAAGKA